MGRHYQKSFEFPSQRSTETVIELLQKLSKVYDEVDRTSIKVDETLAGEDYRVFIESSNGGKIYSSYIELRVSKLQGEASLIQGEAGISDTFLSIPLVLILALPITFAREYQKNPVLPENLALSFGFCIGGALLLGFLEVIAILIFAQRQRDRLFKAVIEPLT
jgi:hypothetical protein